jgi:hypothetical protein
MKRLVRVAMAAVVLGATLNAATLLGPKVAFACSCAGPPALDGTEDAVLVGRVGVAAGNGRFNFAVERWFKGGAAPAVLLQSALTEFADGQTVIDTCGLNLVPGSHLVLAASRGEGALVPAACSPNATVESPEGQALLATAERLFGIGQVPGEPPPPAADGPAVDLGPVAIGATLLILSLIGIVLLLAIGRREPPARPEP